MKALRKILDNVKPQFEKGGKFEKLHSVYDGFETFLFVPDKTSKSGVHIHDYNDMKRTMITVVVALIPALLFGMYNVGYQHFHALGETAAFWDTFFYGLIRVLPLVIVSYTVGLGIEFAFAQVRGHEIQEGFLVSGMLIPLIVPIDVPLWMVAVATAFAVIFAKEAFGGTGMNVFNVALITRAFLFFAYPAFMSGDNVWIRGIAKGAPLPDGFSGATALSQAALAHSGEAAKIVDGFGNPVSLWDMFAGFIPGSIGETSTLAILIGAAILILTGVGSWKIIVSTFAGGYLMALLFHAVAGGNAFMLMPAHDQIVLGGFAFGAVFMATDPVTGSRTESGKWIYGFLIGALAILIRIVNPAYPEGVMLAILIMNIFAPLIDHVIVHQNINRRLKRAKANA